MKKFGLMRAIGATRLQVQRLFLLESVILTLLGGSAGIALGLGIAQGIRIMVPGMPVYTPARYIVAALLVCGAAGVLSGLIPARRAASLDPVDALRTE